MTSYAHMLGATDVFAGVRHGNVRSVAVLRRAGFVESVHFDDYTRFRLPLATGPQAPPP